MHLARGGLHHVVGGTHDASVGLGDRGLPVDVGGLGLRWSGGQCQERLASTRAKALQGQLGTGKWNRYLKRE